MIPRSSKRSSSKISRAAPPITIASRVVHRLLQACPASRLLRVHTASFGRVNALYARADMEAARLGHARAVPPVAGRRAEGHGRGAAVGYPLRMSFRVGAALVSMTAVFSGGCLSTAHKIPKQELVALSQEEPRARAERVRVIQGFAGEDEPPEAPPVHSSTHVHVGASVHMSGSPAPRRGPNFKKAAASEADDARWWLIAAGIAAVGLAVTEGARYDGWVELHPMHPVHIYGPYGEYTWVPLAQLDPETASWARKAFVRETEGPWKPLERAPLNRVGWTYSFLLGAAEIPSAAEKQAFGASSTGEPGFMGHIQLGLFPAQHLGVLLDFGMGYRQNEFDDTVFEARNALELQVLPLSAGRLHAGLYGDIGIGLRVEDGAKTSSERRAFLGGAGGLLQLELTTRLTITGRVGVTHIFGETTSEAALGLSIY